MLIKKHITNILFYFFIVLFLTEQTFAENEYYKCPEKINTVLTGESQYIAAGSIIGVNYVKISGISTPFTGLRVSQTTSATRPLDRTPSVGVQVIKPSSLTSMPSGALMNE